MSIRVMTAVWDIVLPDSEKIVMLALADCANDEGYCWPSMATLARKCSKSDRTVQTAIKALCAAGHLTRNEVRGKGCSYLVHPRKDCTPEAVSPRKDCTPPPKPLRDTPEAASDKPSKNHQEPSTLKRGRAKAGATRLCGMPVDWMPQPFGNGTASRKIVDGWPPGRIEREIELFCAAHGAKGNLFADWQKAWTTWVLRSEKMGGEHAPGNYRSRPERPGSGGDHSIRDAFVRASVARDIAGGAGP